MGPEPCGSATCAGCCDASGVCQVGETDDACGLGGGACVACQNECVAGGVVAPGSSCPTFASMYRACQAGACLPKKIGGADGACCSFWPNTGCDAQTGECAEP